MIIPPTGYLKEARAICKENDIVLIAPWDFNTKRADVVWRYIRAHADWLAANDYLPEGLKS